VWFCLDALYVVLSTKLLRDTAIMPNLYPLARHVFGCLRPEFARDLTVCCLEAGLGCFMVDGSARKPDAPLLAQELWSLQFPNPIGLAAGFDKDARVPDRIMDDWGFGFVEVGTVTPRQQDGNDKPRVFRLKEDGAIINRMGFNSCGLPEVIQRLQARSQCTGIVGLNLGKNRATEDAAADYEEGIRKAAGLVNYLVVNVSSPNTPGLRDLQHRSVFEDLLKRLIVARDKTGMKTPLLVKIAPDLSDQECEDIASISLSVNIDGIIISNTTIERLPNLRSSASREDGGLSGEPLFERSTKLLARVYTLTRGRLPLIGVGGVATPAQAYEKICAGASLVQLYTALAFQGPMLVSKIKLGLADLLRANGFSSVEAAVGAKSAAWSNASSGSHSPVRLGQSEKAGVISRAKRRRLSREPWPLSST
jgi:dihydroorotate dehydrogenase